MIVKMQMLSRKLTIHTCQARVMANKFVVKHLGTLCRRLENQKQACILTHAVKLTALNFFTCQ